MIVAAAIKFGDAIVSVPKPGRHSDVYQAIWSTMGIGNKPTDVDMEYIKPMLSMETQGFITDEGEFLNREDSLSHAVNSGQVTGRADLIGSVLTSEDLW